MANSPVVSILSQYGRTSSVRRLHYACAPSVENGIRSFRLTHVVSPISIPRSIAVGRYNLSVRHRLPGQVRLCYKCQQAGHMARDCPQHITKKSKYMMSQEEAPQDTMPVDDHDDDPRTDTEREETSERALDNTEEIAQNLESGTYNDDNTFKEPAVDPTHETESGNDSGEQTIDPVPNDNVPKNDPTTATPLRGVTSEQSMTTPTINQHNQLDDTSPMQSTPANPTCQQMPPDTNTENPVQLQSMSDIPLSRKEVDDHIPRSRSPTPHESDNRRSRSTTPRNRSSRERSRSPSRETLYVPYVRDGKEQWRRARRDLKVTPKVALKSKPEATPSSQ